MKEYIKSILVAGLTVLASAGIAVLFVEDQPLILRLLLSLFCFALAGGGVYAFFLSGKLNLTALEGKKMTAGMLIRSLITAAAVVAIFTLLLYSDVRMMPLTIIMGTMAVSFTLMFFYHIYLLIRQGLTGNN
ncbi:MAG: hypothetical protein IJM79_03280 [Erysipelotrichaceae bacterium]|nr:hypothetical protein [Erysipelotrichaceae bacterium]